MDERIGSWKVFRVILAGRTNGAHRSIVQKLKDIGQTEETSREESDYCVVFCPVVSRVGTDIAEALDKLPFDKPAILVVMHHTYNPHHVVAKSQSQVNNSNVHLTVDCLFYEDHLLDCDLNNIMWNDIRRTFRSPNRQTLSLQSFQNCWEKPTTKWIIIGISIAVVIIVVIVAVSVEMQKKKEP
ncbi:unnamed protein product [Oreochromis niloticus]|nr:unnamed protein product [Mustela putorius furo]